MYIFIFEFQVSKENIANIYNTITLENAQHVAQGAIDNVQNAASVAQDTINTGIDNTITISMFWKQLLYKYGSIVIIKVPCDLYPYI